MKNSVLYVNSKSDYFYGWEPQCHQLIKSGVFYRVLAKIFSQLNQRAPSFLLVNNNATDYDKVIIVDSAFEKSVYQRLVANIGKKNTFIYLMNPIKKIKKNKWSAIWKSVNHENIYTFSKLEADQYNLKYLHTPYSKKFSLKYKNEENRYDLVFLGRDKGRMLYISKLYKLLSRRGYRLNFKVLTDNQNAGNITIDKMLKYEDYIKLVCESKAILEVTQSDQSGCTLRFLESLAYGKKLITTNSSTYEDEYYEPKSMMVINPMQDDIDSIARFLDAPIEIKADIPRQLDLEFWLEEFS